MKLQTLKITRYLVWKKKLLYVGAGLSKAGNSQNFRNSYISSENMFKWVSATIIVDVFPFVQHNRKVCTAYDKNTFNNTMTNMYYYGVMVPGRWMSKYRNFVRHLCQCIVVVVVGVVVAKTVFKYNRKMKLI